MPLAPHRINFTYSGSSPSGPIDGTLLAESEASARSTLESLGIEITALSTTPPPNPPPFNPPSTPDPTAISTPPNAPQPPQPVQPVLSAMGAIRGADLVAFNHQLAALATAGLPLEQGLRLAASEARTRRVRRAIDALATDLESGHSLPAAFDRHRGSFPPIYSRLVEAALATGSLPALLLSLGRHQLSLDRLRASVTRAMIYPFVLFIGITAIGALIATFVLPQMVDVYKMLSTQTFVSQPYPKGLPPPQVRIPWSTQLVMVSAPYLPLIAVSLIGVLLSVPIVTGLLRIFRLDTVVADRLVLPLPLLGPALKHSALARFADSLSISVRAGVNLPEALRLSADVVGYPRLQADAQHLAAMLEAGRTDPSAPPALQPRLIPPTLISAILAPSSSTSLADTLEALAQLHRQQSELRSQRIPLLLLPLALLFLAAIVALLMAAVIAPMSQSLRTFM